MKEPDFIFQIVKAARDPARRPELEARFARLAGEMGRSAVPSLRRILDGERDEVGLTAGLPDNSARLVRLVLETLKVTASPAWLFADGDKLIHDRFVAIAAPLRGGFGIVHRCFDVEDDRPVALKTFRPELLSNAAAREAFLREGATWISLGAHPNVVRAYGVSRGPDGSIFLVLELVATESGRADPSLRSWLKGRPLPTPRALLVALQIARGMAHAVRTIPDLVHGDLKPENVLVGADLLPSTTMNRVRVTDFGLATLSEGLAPSSLAPMAPAVDDARALLQHTRIHGRIAGTPLYMAPEQWEGGVSGIATDVYAVGCILQEVLCGAPAAAGSTPSEVERAHRTGALREPGAGVPPDVVALLRRCLALDPAARFTSWDELESAIADVYGRLTGEAPPSSGTTTELARGERLANAWGLATLGMSYLDLGKVTRAREHFERARSVAEVEADANLESLVHNELGLACLDEANPSAAIEHFERAIALSDLDVSAALSNLGCAYLDLGDVQRAIECHEKALARCRQDGDRRGEGKALGNLANAYSKAGNYPKAIAQYQARLDVAREIADLQGELIALTGLGRTLAASGDTERAKVPFAQALTGARRLGEPPLVADVLICLATVHADEYETRTAVPLVKEAVALLERIDGARNRKHQARALLERVLNAEQFLEASVAAARGVRRAREAIERGFEEPGLTQGLAPTIRRIWAGERDARTLTEGIEANEARLVMAILRRLAERPSRDRASEAKDVRKAYGSIIDAIVEVALGRGERRERVEVVLRDAETKDFHILVPVQRIWAGERDEAALTAGLDDIDAAIVTAVLAGIAAPGTSNVPTEGLAPFAPLIKAIARATFDTRGRDALLGLLEQLAANGLPIVEPVRRIWAGERSRDRIPLPRGGLGRAIVTAILDAVEERARRTHEALRRFEPLIEDAAAACTRPTLRSAVVTRLDQAHEKGFLIARPVHQIWQGARDADALVADLDDIDAAIVRAVLDRVDGRAAPRGDETQAAAGPPDTLGDAPASGDRPVDEIVSALGDFIDAVVALAHGDQDLHGAVAEAVDDLEARGFAVGERIRRIAEGSRDRAQLVDGLDATDAALISAIVDRLG